MIITKLTSLSNNKVLVQFDLSPSLIIPVDIAVLYSLKSQKDISNDTYTQIKQEAIQHSLWNQVLKWATLRPRSIAEFDHYSQDKLTTEQLNNFKNRLTELGFLSDSKFSSWWVESRQVHRPKSKLELQQELKSKGVSGSDLDTALSQSDQESACLAVAQKYIKKLTRFSDFEKKQKLFAYLFRRGFPSTIIKNVISKILIINVE